VNVSELLNQINFKNQNLCLQLANVSKCEDNIKVVGIDWDDDDFYLIPEGWLDYFDNAYPVIDLKSLTEVIAANQQVLLFNIFGRIENKWTEEGTAISSNSQIIDIKFGNEVVEVFYAQEASTLTFKGARNIKYIQSPATE